MKYILLLLFLTGLNLMAQPLVWVYTDIGQNNVSDGIYWKAAGFGKYQYDSYFVETGFQVDIKSSNENILSGYSIKGVRRFFIKDFPLDFQGFFMWKPLSGIFTETNWGMVLNHKRNRIDMNLGSGFRTFAKTKKAIAEYNIDPATKVRENWNLLYSFGCYLKPMVNNWNIGLAVTNIDHFILNQETNPVFYLRSLYDFNHSGMPLSLFVESWYKSAGAFNLSVNYFGFHFRTGLVWNID